MVEHPKTAETDNTENRGLNAISSLNETPRSERLHIGFFGKTNSGKSSLINALAGQEIALVSPVHGTTTDPVYKAMELLPIGPVVLIDSAGLDDKSILGSLRVAKTKELLAKTDIAVLVVASTAANWQEEEKYLKEFSAYSIPVITVINDFGENNLPQPPVGLEPITLNALEKEGIDRLKTKLIELSQAEIKEKTIAENLVKPDDLVLLVMPQDIQTPKGRLILPQIQTIRALLDSHCTVIISQTDELAKTLKLLKNPPNLVITDSQAFQEVYQVIGDTIPLTSFSLLMACLKGDVEEFVEGAQAIASLKPHDRVLIAEACTHHALKNDIAREKIPMLLEKKVGGKLEFTNWNGHNFPDDIQSYKLIIHCGACMINSKNMLYRQGLAKTHNVPITNFGVCLAYLSGILNKVVY